MLRNLFVIPVLVVALVFSGFSSVASASVITTQQAMSAEARTTMERDARASLARDDVRQAMLKLGADPVQAQSRVASLSDAELMQLQGQLDRLPAGADGGALVVIGVVFLVLVILELTGVTNIFNRF